MRLAKAVLIAVGAIVLLSLGALLIAPSLLRERVVEIVESTLSERLEATVDFQDVELSLLSTFPALTIEITGLNAVGTGVFEGTTLAGVQSFRAEVDLFRLVRDEQLLVESATIDQPELNLLVNEDGKANYDILKERDADPGETEAEVQSEALSVRLREVQINGGVISYDAPGRFASIEGLDHRGSAGIDGATYTSASSTTIEALSVQVGGVRYCKRARVSLDVSAILRTEERRLTVDNIELAVNELSAVGSGEVHWRDRAVNLDLGLASGEMQSIRALVSVIPNAYAGDIAGLQARGTYALRAKVKGRLGPEDDDLPSFSASLSVRNGALQHPDLPVPLTDIAFEAKATHPGGNLDKMNIDIPSYAARAGESHLAGRLAMSAPLSGPDMALLVEGHLNMDEIAQAYPMSDIEELRGSASVKLDFTVKGNHVERLTGGVAASGIVVQQKDAPSLQISTVAAHFTRKETEVRTFNALYGRSDIAAIGWLSPFDVILAALLSDDETILGDLTLTSKLIDLDEFSGEDFPFALDVGLFLDLEKLVYRKQTFPNVKGSARFKDNKLTLTDVTADALRYVETSISSLTTPTKPRFRRIRRQK
jgi:hypothetical protein